MKNLDLIAEELFNKIRGRFPSITIGDGEGKVTNKPTEARFFDFDYVESENKLGKVSISLSDDAVEVMYSNDFVANEDIITRENWYEFLKELRQFSKKRMLKFDTRNINKSNLDQRDYKFLATNRTGDGTMNESKMYGTSKTSYQNVGEARIAIKHSKPVNTESATGRIQNINAIFIESPEGERFKYPYRHLNGARAMARHVAEGGKPFDDFGKHITGLSEELNSLKKFKSYVGRSSVMAEGLSGYMLPVNERLNDIKKTISSLQKESTYRTAFENFEQPVFEDVPEDVAENWIDQLTIKQFNEELKDVFPFVYRLVSEATKATVMTAESLLGEARETYTVQPGDTLYSIAREMVKYEMKGMDINDAVEMLASDNGIDDPAMIKPGMELQIPWVTGAVGGDPMTGEPITRGLPPEAYESELDSAFEEMMGQFSSLEEAAGCSCNDGGKCTCPADCPDCNCNESANESESDLGEKQIPVTEFVLSLFDRETGQFPKGETAVLTAVEKDYGEQYIDPAKAFIEAINAKFEEFNGYRDPELMDDMTDESALMGHIGKKKYGKDGMAALSQAGRDGASEEELGRIKDKYKKESEDLRRLAGL